MKNFFKNKKVGYYIIALDIILAVVLGILFFATYKGSNGNGQLNMANKAYASLPEMIGIFALVGAAIDITALVLPEFGWLHLLAIGAYCVSLMKEIYTVPDIIVGVANGIAYEGGNFPLNVTWLALQFTIIISGIVACFLGALSPEAEASAKAEKLAGAKLIKVGASAVVVVASVLAGSLASATIAKSQNQGTDISDVEEEDPAEIAFREAWQDKVVEYDFNPDEFKLSEDENEWADPAVKNQIKTTVGSNLKEREDVYKVYEFEGATAEGWQGDYSLKKSYLSLWSDGLYNGTSNGTAICGYWYNVDKYGEDCLVMISASDDNNMVCNKLAGESSYYEWSVDVKASYNGGRLIKVQGLKYTPVIGMYIDTGAESIDFHVGDVVNTGLWSAMQVRNNFKRGSIFDAEHEVKWTNTTIKASETGKQTLTATWNGFTAEVEVNVVD